MASAFRGAEDEGEDNALTSRVEPFRLVRPETLPGYQSPPTVLTHTGSPD